MEEARFRVDGVKEYWATKCKHNREATEVVDENPKEEERCEAQHTSSVRRCVQLVSSESESGGYKRAEDERDRVSLVPALPPPLPAPLPMVGPHHSLVSNAVTRLQPAPGSGDLEPHAR